MSLIIHHGKFPELPIDQYIDYDFAGITNGTYISVCIDPDDSIIGEEFNISHEPEGNCYLDIRPMGAFLVD